MRISALACTLFLLVAAVSAEAEASRENPCDLRLETAEESAVADCKSLRRTPKEDGGGIETYALVGTGLEIAGVNVD